jgi:hypothetical protein
MFDQLKRNLYSEVRYGQTVIIITSQSLKITCLSNVYTTHINEILSWSWKQSKRCEFLGAFAKLQKATISFVTSVRVCLTVRTNNSAPTERIFMKFDIWVLFENVEKIKFHQNLTWIASTLHEVLCTFMVISRWILKGNVADKSCWENKNTHLMFKNICFPKIVPSIRQSGKIWYNRTDHRWRYKTANALCVPGN